MAAETKTESSSSPSKDGPSVELPENRFALELEFGKSLWITGVSPVFWELLMLDRFLRNQTKSAIIGVSGLSTFPGKYLDERRAIVAAMPSFQGLSALPPHYLEQTRIFALHYLSAFSLLSGASDQK